MQHCSHRWPVRRAGNFQTVETESRVLPNPGYEYQFPVLWNETLCIDNAPVTDYGPLPAWTAIR